MHLISCRGLRLDKARWRSRLLSGSEQCHGLHLSDVCCFKPTTLAFEWRLFGTDLLICAGAQPVHTQQADTFAFSTIQHSTLTQTQWHWEWKWRVVRVLAVMLYAHPAYTLTHSQARLHRARPLTQALHRYPRPIYSFISTLCCTTSFNFTL